MSNSEKMSISGLAYRIGKLLSSPENFTSAIRNPQQPGRKNQENASQSKTPTTANQISHLSQNALDSHNIVPTCPIGLGDRSAGWSAP